MTSPVAPDPKGLLHQLPRPDATRQGWPWTVETDPAVYRGRGDWPCISIVTPSYNQGEFIEETIRSVLLQNYPNLEYVVIDGGSTDHSVAVIEKYSPWISHWVSEKDRGQSDALNKGFARASGSIFGWLNSDDVLLDGALSKVGAHPWDDELGALVGVGRKVDRKGRVVHEYPYVELKLESLLDWRATHFLQPACFFSRQAWDTCGPLDTELHFCMDVDLWLKIARRFRFERIPDVLAHAYFHPAAKTTAERYRMKLEICLVTSRHGGLAIARREAFELLDQLREPPALKSVVLRKIVATPPYQNFFGPIYRALKKRLRKSEV